MKDNIVYLRKNKNRTLPTHPEYKGSGVAQGVEVWASGYVNEGEGGEKYLKISLTPKNDNNTKVTPKPEAVKSDFSDELGW